MPEEEKEELALIYQSKGLDEAQAKALAERLTANKAVAPRYPGARGIGHRP